MSKTRSTILFLISASMAGAILPTSALGHEFQTCQNVGANMGMFSTSTCGTAGAPKEFEWKQIVAATNFVTVNNARSSEIHSLKVLVKCDETNLTGKVELMGNFTGTMQLNNNCSFYERINGGGWVNPKGCTVTQPISFEVKGELITGGTSPLFTFGAKGGKLMTQIKTTGVGCSNYNFESISEGKGQVCSSTRLSEGNPNHYFTCDECQNTELLFNTEAAAFVTPIIIRLEGMPWWRAI
jgi:hypothetical protein